MANGELWFQKIKDEADWNEVSQVAGETIGKANLKELRDLLKTLEEALLF